MPPGNQLVNTSRRIRPPREPYLASGVFMDTLVSIEIAAPPAGDLCRKATSRAFGWFREVEQRCSRFDPDSELASLSRTAGVAIPVSDLLFRAIEFALAVAQESDGAFDPTVGRTLERHGFDRNYRTGERIVRDPAPLPDATYRDVVLDPTARTVTLLRPLVLDLGAVAKGLAIDLAVESLHDFHDYAIYAGGDMYLAGRNSEGAPWQVGIRHPRLPETLIETLSVSGAAVCTSGDYERVRPDGEGGHHIVEPATGGSAHGAASVTVVAPTAMLADALATAAFVVGPERGIGLLERSRVEGMIVTPSLTVTETAGFARHRG